MPRPSRRFLTTAVATATVIAIIAGLIGVTLLARQTQRVATAAATAETSTGLTTLPGAAAAQSTAEADPAQPEQTPASPFKNVVLILADDLDWKLWNDVPRLRNLKSQGMTFTNYVVSDSLCCPSRTTILRGQYVHNHQVVSNDAVSGGGWPVFRARGYPNDCLPVWLQKGGVHTGLVGKYLNEYPQSFEEAKQPQPGWDDFFVPFTTREAYAGYNYVLTDNGTIKHYGSRPEDYLNDVLDRAAVEFLALAPDHFFLELAPLTPHLPAPVAKRHEQSHLDALAPRDPSFNAPVTNGPSWQTRTKEFGPKAIKRLDALWRKRAQSAEAFADSVDAVFNELRRSGHINDTLVLVTSDNGFHVGSYRGRGKRTAYDSDTVVPLVAIGPGVPQGQTIARMTSETDLAPTIATALGVQAPNWVDGQSIAGYMSPLLQPDGAEPNTRTAALSESLGSALPGDPDFQLQAPPNFTAMRTEEWLYVESLSGEKELYNRVTDPYELNNIITTAPADVVSALQAQFTAMKSCAGDSCRVADSMPVPSAR